MKNLALFLLLLLPALPVRGEGDPLQEAEALATQGKSEFEKAHEMKPSAERNAVLCEARAALKHGIAKYQLLQSLMPDRAKEFAAAATDLQGMIFWCNKSMAIITPPAPPSPEPVPPPPTTPSPPPQAESPVPPPSALPPSETPRALDLKQAAVLFGSLKDLYGKMEEAQDSAAHRRESVKDIYATLESMRANWEKVGAGASWGQTKDFEAFHDGILENARKQEKRALEAMRSAQKMESQARASRAQLEYWGPPGLQALADWAKGREDLPEGLMGYLNQQLASPRFTFTPLPPSSSLPTEAGLGPKAAEVRTLLDTLARQDARDETLASALAEGEAETEHLQGEIRDLDAHWAWRTKSFKWTMDHLKLKEQRKRAAQEGIARLQAAGQKAQKEREALAPQIADLLARLEALPADRARVVEAWRLKQQALPLRTGEAVEAWTRKALGL